MRISRKKRPKKLLIPHYAINSKIRTEHVRVIDVDGKNLGVMSTADAIALAKEKEFDLVEINPKSDPPVAQITDFTHLKYQKEKEARKQKQNTRLGEIKGIRLSVRIGKGDIETRRKQSERFLERGDKVKLEIILRGAERFKTPLAYEVIRNFYALLNETFPVKYEQEATRQGNKITAILVKK
ncbi:MAG: translation initiation factor IF-3 [Candidatus Magasanikbacteria bacterium CG10_big_fil_rev_8_21_14_0_10_47_10]|uniref:Translation initiation factor IF-3 n=1 Tax=Candidatus Magasanikbacteria bacterium CG10_big_fil_rev_8_21_14_0_10_47_10 TaxID=1974652 RepID=A0A2H0TQZ8_9BACT|nr:MAG: translation initiation factor IF-3 [Candidatus Magasanikbacteria bacterium CG10_big_fil_rev_8_21_14_0_10_47_10]